MKSILKCMTAAIGLFACVSTAAAQAPDTIAKIKQRGTIVVGVKNDYKPWGYLDPSGKIVGHGDRSRRRDRQAARRQSRD